MLISLYRRILPLTVREFIYDSFLGKILFFKRNFKIILRSKLTYLFGFLLPKNEENKAFSFMGRHGITSYPSAYMLEYQKIKIQVELDEEQDMPYVFHNEKKLYFPKSYSSEKIQKDYRALIIEQDIRSAHRYVQSYSELENRTLLDVGAAEGIFSLQSIELTRHVIIFECEDYWLKPLKATFAPWSHKVTFVKKYVGNKMADNFITIDEFMSGKEKENLFIKMDIEGAERNALEGAANTLKSGKNIQLAICTYHRKNDPKFIANLVAGCGYSYQFTDGLMYWNKRVSKGVIRCKK